MNIYTCLAGRFGKPFNSRSPTLFLGSASSPIDLLKSVLSLHLRISDDLVAIFLKIQLGEL